MESHLPFFAIILTFLLFMWMVIKTMKRQKPLNLPPSPWKLPILGNLLQLAASGSLPHRSLANLAKKHGPLMYLQLGEVPTIVVSSPETAEEVLKGHDINFSNRPSYLLAFKILTYNSTDIVFSPYGSYWRKLRQICVTELLSPKRVNSFRSIREAEVSNLITTISSSQGAPINLTKMIFSLTYNITSIAAFGNKWKVDQERFISNLKTSVELAAGFRLSDMYPSIKVLEAIGGFRPKLEKIHRENDEILQNILNKHREGKMDGNGEVDHKDLLDIFLDLQEHGEFESPLTILPSIFLQDIFAAGTDASSIIVEWAMSEMLKHPQVMNKAQAEVREAFHEKGNVDETGIDKLKFLKAVIKETLRLHPSAPLLLPRECTEKCVISGYEVPFGAGRRICPGITFALPNIELPLANLLFHFDWKLPDGKRLEDLDMTEGSGSSVGRKDKLFLIPIPFHRLSELLLDTNGFQRKFMNTFMVLKIKKHKRSFVSISSLFAPALFAFFIVFKRIYQEQNQ